MAFALAGHRSRKPGPGDSRYGDRSTRMDFRKRAVAEHSYADLLVLSTSGIGDGAGEKLVFVVFRCACLLELLQLPNRQPGQPTFAFHLDLNEMNLFPTAAYPH